jgi:DHA1 family bicyclomycin/chloramphenicol resistance-like MFS transporter
MRAGAVIASSTLPALPRPAISVAAAATALALLLGLQPVSTDLYLPALPQLTRELSAPMSAVQMTMAGLILAFGVAQMVWGPIADRFGRRPVLLMGLLLYTAASAGCAFAGSIEALVVWRALQGAALAAAVVCARAIVRDLYEPVQGAQVMALALSGLGVLALASPLLGGLLTMLAGWRWALGLVALIGLATLAYVAWRLPETLPRPNLKALQAAELLRTWWTIGSNGSFLAWALLVSCTYGGLFTVLASSSFVFIDLLGMSAVAYGAAMALGSVCYIAGTFVCRRWIKLYGMAGTVWRAAFFTLTAGVGLAATAALGFVTWWSVLLPYGLYAFGHGMHQPCGQAGVVAPFPRNAGAASALAGLLMALIAFGIGRWLGAGIDGTVRPLAYGVCFWACLTCAVGWTLVQRRTG